MQRLFLSPTGLVTLGVLAIGGYLLWTRHETHLLIALPWLLIGGCLVMHLFMHGGHGGTNNGDDGDR